MNSSAPLSYDCLHTSSITIPAGQTDDPSGGWSLYDGELMDTWPQIGDGRPNRVACALFCHKQITFSDGTVWENPGFEDWLETYRGKPVSLEAAQAYYPYAQALEGPFKPQ